MSNRTLIYMTCIVIGAIAMLTLINVMSIFWDPYPEIFIKHNDIRGSAIFHQNKPYTLNFDQQNEFIDLLNRTLLVAKGEPATDFKPELEKIVIYLFDNKPDVVVTPVSLNEKQNYTFSIPAWDTDNLFVDTSGGKLYELLSKTYD